jgi:hypothetical protein
MRAFRNLVRKCTGALIRLILATLVPVAFHPESMPLRLSPTTIRSR